MASRHRPSRSSLIGWCLSAFALTLLANFALAGSADYAVRNGTVAGGGGTVSAGQFKLTWTIGEAAMGSTAQTPYRLTSGFPATIGTPCSMTTAGCRIFSDGFED